MAKDKKNKPKIGKRESSILLFIIVLACIIFMGFLDDKEAPKDKIIENNFSLTNQDGEKVAAIDIEKKN